jgi:hypothetical protein
MAQSVRMQIYQADPSVFDDPNFASLLGETMVINGGTYCRSHLRKECHVCEVSCTHPDDAANEERSRLGLRPVGDPGLDKASEELDIVCKTLVMDFRLQQEIYLKENEGKPGFKEGFKPGLVELAKENEARINATYCFDKCTTCAWKGCQTPMKQPLLRCGGCKIVRYCW